jgi:peptidoglycan/LPS O-acetylase OafA/YrhL
MKSAIGKVKYLDGIRGLAAFCVFLHHFGLAFYPAYYGDITKLSHLGGLEINYGSSVFSFLTNGSFCVHIFFILSGYVLSRKYYQTNDIQIITASAWKRYLRLFIPVGFTIIIAYLLMQAGLYYNVPASVITHSEGWLGGFWTFDNATMVFLKSLVYDTMLFGNNTLDTTLWTMSIELYGSMLVFGVLAMTHRAKNKWIGLVAASVFLMLINKTLYTCFILGISFNYIETHTPKLNKNLLFLLSILFMAAGCVLGSYHSIHTEGTLFGKLPHSIMALKNTFLIVGGYFVILSVIISPRMQAFFSSPALRFLGAISFSLYLLHVLIIGSFSSFVFLKLAGMMGYNAAVGVVFLLTTPVVLVLSHLMTQYVDMKGVKLAGALYDRYVKKK